MDHVRKAKLSVLAIGAIAVTLIMWLAGSFWFEAYQQHVDAVQIARVSKIDYKLMAVSQDLAAERTTTSAMLASKSSPDEDALAVLRTTQQRSEKALMETLESIDLLLADKAIAPRLQFSSEAVQEIKEALERTLAALNLYRDAFNANIQGTIAGNSSPIGEFQRNEVQDSIFGLTTALIAHTLSLQDGILLMPRTTVSEVADLQRLRASLQKFDNAMTLDTALLSATGLLASDPSNLERLRQSESRINHSVADLQAHLREQRPEADLLTGIDDFIRDQVRARIPLRVLMAERFSLGLATQQERNEWLMFGANAQAATAELGQEIRDDIIAISTTLKHKAVKRLLIDSLLIVICLWIVFASMKLLAKIHHQAYSDRLTGLPNRFRCEQLLRGADDVARAHQEIGAVIVIDIDDFQSVNDTLGHAIADQLLVAYAKRLNDSIDDAAIACAIGGDEFVIIVPDVREAEKAMAIAEKVRNRLQEKFEIDGALIQKTVSMGVCLFPDQVRSADELLKNADIALCQAKDNGRGQVQMFSQELHDKFQQRVQLEADLRVAVEQEQFELHYQPKVSTVTGRVDGVEALIRWNHPERGQISPFFFIPAAESCGLITAIGTWVLQEACRQTAQWHKMGYPGLQVAVNVSAEQFIADDFIDLVYASLTDNHLEPASLELEVTESVGMNDMSLVVERLDTLRKNDISIAIDDFGTDYSSLQYLEDLPLDCLKIDRAFILKLEKSDKGKSLANTIVLMARSFNLKTVAEGVESEEQLRRVIDLGCDYIQGYYYSRPVSADELPATIERIHALRDSDDQLSASNAA